MSKKIGEEMENQEKLEEMKDVKVEKKDEKLDAEKVQEIVKKAKAKGKITYEELAKELENTNPDQIDKVFDAFEEMGVNILNDDFEDEPDIDDLKEVENLKLDDAHYAGLPFHVHRHHIRTAYFKNGSSVGRMHLPAVTGAAVGVELNCQNSARFYRHQPVLNGTGHKRNR